MKPRLFLPVLVVIAVLVASGAIECLSAAGLVTDGRLAERLNQPETSALAAASAIALADPGIALLSAGQGYTASGAEYYPDPATAGKKVTVRVLLDSPVPHGDYLLEYLLALVDLPEQRVVDLTPVDTAGHARLTSTQYDRFMDMVFNDPLVGQALTGRDYEVGRVSLLRSAQKPFDDLIALVNIMFDEAHPHDDTFPPQNGIITGSYFLDKQLIGLMVRVSESDGVFEVTALNNQLNMAGNQYIMLVALTVLSLVVSLIVYKRMQSAGCRD